MSKAANRQCIVMYDDGDQLTLPYTFDEECEGALRCMAPGDPIAVFPTSKEARRAIQISMAFAKLSKAQGKPVNEDFTTCIKCVKVVPLVSAKGGAT